MYNASFKNKFIRSFTESKAVRDYCITLFNTSEQYEREYKKDLSEFSSDQMRVIFLKRSGIRKSTRATLTNVINAYLLWAKENGRNVICNVKKDMVGDDVIKFRSKVVFSPKHLNDYMDVVFGAIEEQTVGVVYRCFLWLAFCGLDLRDSQRLTESDIDLDYMRVMVNGKEVPLYSESIPAFKAIKGLKELRVINPHLPESTIFVERECGDRLLRTSRRIGISKAEYDNETRSISNEITRKTRKAFDSGLVKSRLSYNNVRLSGIMYRMYLRESMGMEPDFSIIAAIEMADDVFENKGSYFAKRSRIINNYKRDYEVWKQAYEMYREDSLL